MFLSEVVFVDYGFVKFIDGKLIDVVRFHYEPGFDEHVDWHFGGGCNAGDVECAVTDITDLFYLSYSVSIVAFSVTADTYLVIFYKYYTSDKYAYFGHDNRGVSSPISRWLRW